MLATLALKQGCKPATIHEDSVLLRAYQATLIDDGMPLSWAIDMPLSHPDFAAVQRLLIEHGFGSHDDALLFHPDEAVSVEDRSSWLPTALPDGVHVGDSLTRAELACLLSDKGSSS